MIAIVAAMKDEVRRLGSLRRTAKGQASVTVSGVGKEKALAAASSLCDGDSPPSLVLSIGFSGALSDDLSVGDLVLARRLLSTGRLPTPDDRPAPLSTGGSRNPRKRPPLRPPRYPHGRQTGPHPQRAGKAPPGIQRPGRQPGGLLDMPRRLSSRRALRVRAGDFGHHQPGASPLRGRNHAPAGGPSGDARHIQLPC